MDRIFSGLKIISEAFKTNAEEKHLEKPKAGVTAAIKNLSDFLLVSTLKDECSQQEKQNIATTLSKYGLGYESIEKMGGEVVLSGSTNLERHYFNAEGVYVFNVPKDHYLCLQLKGPAQSYQLLCEGPHVLKPDTLINACKLISKEQVNQEVFCWEQLHIFHVQSGERLRVTYRSPGSRYQDSVIIAGREEPYVFLGTNITYEKLATPTSGLALQGGISDVARLKRWKGFSVIDNYVSVDTKATSQPSASSESATPEQTASPQPKR